MPPMDAPVTATRFRSSVTWNSERTASSSSVTISVSQASEPSR